jgi:hypothetical protein
MEELHEGPVFCIGTKGEKKKNCLSCPYNHLCQEYLRVVSLLIPLYGFIQVVISCGPYLLLQVQRSHNIKRSSSVPAGVRAGQRFMFEDQQVRRICFN